MVDIAVDSSLADFTVRSTIKINPKYHSQKSNNVLSDMEPPPSYEVAVTEHAQPEGLSSPTVRRSLSSCTAVSTYIDWQVFILLKWPHDLDTVVDVVSFADVLDAIISWGYIAPLTEVDV